jgi:hypothetical protein
MNVSDFESRIEQLGGVRQLLSQREAWQLMQDWRQVFAAAYHASSQKWKFGKFEWHIFSYEYVPSIKGDKAIWEYFAQPVVPFYLITDDNEGLPSYRLVDICWPDLRSWYLDVYIWPVDLSWTMAFTHESDSGFGPYFARNTLIR